MVSVADAERLILAEIKNYGTELVPFDPALGRVLAEPLCADRDLPPCNRATMDGIAISYAAFEKGIRSFSIKATIAAGDAPVDIATGDECVEIMTGAPLPGTTDTVVRYEDLAIKDGIAAITADTIKAGQNIHRKGRDKRQGDVVAEAGQFITPALISMAASTGNSMLPVKKLPKVVIISTGDELVDTGMQPTAYQVRQSNNHTIRAVLQQYRLDAAMLHLPDDLEITKESIKKCLGEYDVIILTGGVSMGKFDYVPQVLAVLSVTRLFHKVQQRPGKPFWFGKDANGVLVFAFPGNPVSTFLCLHRYFIPWLETSLTSPYSFGEGRATSPSPLGEGRGEVCAILNTDVTFTAPLQYFMQVKISISAQGQLLATPIEGNGSGDFANLLDSNAFMELPLEQSNFRKGEVYRIWPFKRII